MTVPNLVTSSRLILAPLFFLAYFVPRWTGALDVAGVIVLWAIFVVIEVSDALDGSVARQRDEVTDVGKLLDPFSDVFARLTYFVCFAVTGIMPVWMFMIILYRELAINFVRLIVYNRGIALGARRGGKLKSLFYFFSTLAGLVVVTMDQTALFLEFRFYAGMTATVLFGLAALLALLSFLDYVRVAFWKQK
jgi:CDP-diacylglycerol--glycerol-3-phosphate 3-phosphatidyltransferase